MKSIIWPAYLITMLILICIQLAIAVRIYKRRKEEQNLLTKQEYIVLLFATIVLHLAGIVPIYISAYESYANFSQALFRAVIYSILFPIIGFPFSLPVSLYILIKKRPKN